MKKKRIKVNYKPLAVIQSIAAVGAIGEVQCYDATTDTYEPDYTLTSLVLQPACGISDRDKANPERVNSKLSNMKWHYIIGGVKTLIEATNPDFEITYEGSDKGRIKVKRNVALLLPMTLLFTAEYLDERTSDLYHYNMTRLVNSVNATESNPLVILDSSPTNIWNPLEDPAEQIITATLMVAETNVTPLTAKRKFFWYQLRSNGLLTLVGSDDQDIEVVSCVDNVLKINRGIGAERKVYVCRATYSADGNPATTTNNLSPSRATTILRKVPKYEYDTVNVPDRIAPGTKYIYPEVVVYGAKSVLSNPWTELMAKWYMDDVYMGLANPTPTIDAVTATSGELGVEISDMGNLKATVNETGVVLVDHEGKIYISR